MYFLHDFEENEFEVFETMFALRVRILEIIDDAREAGAPWPDSISRILAGKVTHRVRAYDIVQRSPELVEL